MHSGIDLKQPKTKRIPRKPREKKPNQVQIKDIRFLEPQQTPQAFALLRPSANRLPGQYLKLNIDLEINVINLNDD